MQGCAAVTEQNQALAALTTVVMLIPSWLRLILSHDFFQDSHHLRFMVYLILPPAEEGSETGKVQPTPLHVGNLGSPKELSVTKPTAAAPAPPSSSSGWLPTAPTLLCTSLHAWLLRCPNELLLTSRTAAPPPPLPLLVFPCSSGWPPTTPALSYITPCVAMKLSQ